MEKIVYDFVELDSEAAFQHLGTTFGGVLQNNVLQFQNEMAQGELIKVNLDDGLWIRKWALSVSEKIVLRKHPAPEGEEKKFSLVYFLNPSIFMLKRNAKTIAVTNHRNNLFFSGNDAMEFSVVPKQSFFALDITFTSSWLCHQFGDADPEFKEFLCRFENSSGHNIFLRPCSADEYKTLHELEVTLQPGREDILFNRSRTYKLVLEFFCKLYKQSATNLVQGVVHYEQVMMAERIITADMKCLPKVEAVARQVNLSTSSLLRQFKLLFGKSIYEYYIEKKMDLAKKHLLEHKMTVKEMAKVLGYKQVSAFIEIFTRQHGFSPGTIKTYKSELPFF